MDIVTMCKHYQTNFKNPKDILDWVEHDLKHMGLEQDKIEYELDKARKYLGANNG